jgi:hypothetical protein
MLVKMLFRASSDRTYSVTRTTRKALRGLLVERLEDRAVPAQLTWTGAVDQKWEEPGNWKLPNGMVSAAAPTSADDVTIAPVGQELFRNVCYVAAGGVAKTITVEGNTVLNVTTTLISEGNVVNNGQVTIHEAAKVVVNNNAEFRNNLDLQLGGFAEDDIAGGVIEAVKVVNNSRINLVDGGIISRNVGSEAGGNLVNNGRIFFSRQRESDLGKMYVAGDYTSGGDSSLIFELSPWGQGGVGKLTVDGKATIAGRLSIPPAPGAMPPPEGWSYRLVEADVRVGTFDTVDATIVRTKIVPEYHPKTVDAIVPRKQGAVQPINGIEAVAVTNPVATFTDPGTADPSPGDYLATVDWGDNSGLEVVSVTDEDEDGTFEVRGTHTYAKWGTYTTTITIEDAESPADPITLHGTALIDNVVPEVTAGSSTTVIVGTAFSGNGSFIDPGADAWSATVDYGDGSGEQPIMLNPDKTFPLSHTYQTAGNYTVTVRVRDSRDTGTATFSVSVVKVPSSVSVASSKNPALTTDSVTFTATVGGSHPTGTPPTGTVLFTVGGTQYTASVVNGIAGVTVSGLAAGDHVVTAEYQGDGYYLASSAAPIAQQVRIATSVSLSSSDTEEVYRNNLMLTAQVSSASGTPTGTVTFYDGENALGTVALDANGRATLDASNLDIGTHNLRAVYNPDGFFNSGEASLTQRIGGLILDMDFGVNGQDPEVMGLALEYESPGVWTGTIDAGLAGGTPGAVINVRYTITPDQLGTELLLTWGNEGELYLGPDDYSAFYDESIGYNYSDAPASEIGINYLVVLGFWVRPTF